MNLTDQPTMAAKATVKPNQYLNAHARIEIEGMKHTIMHYLNDRVLGDMGPAIEAVVNKVLEEGHWKALIEGEVRKNLEILFTECVNDAIAYNYDLKQLVRGKVHKEVQDALLKVVKEEK